jgi:hypothetical protein
VSSFDQLSTSRDSPNSFTMASRRAVESHWNRRKRQKGRNNFLIFRASWTSTFWLITSRSLIFSLDFVSLRYTGRNGGNLTNVLYLFFCFLSACKRASRSAFHSKPARFDHSSHLWKAKGEIQSIERSISTPLHCIGTPEFRFSFTSLFFFFAFLTWL